MIHGYSGKWIAHTRCEVSKAKGPERKRALREDRSPDLAWRLGDWVYALIGVSFKLFVHTPYRYFSLAGPKMQLDPAAAENHDLNDLA